MTIPMTSEQDKVLRLMAEKYPTKEIVYEKIVYLKSQLMLPKGTEHFMSDLHGAYDSFFHILNSCSGVIKEKVDYCFGERMTEEEKAEFCTLIYYPREKVVNHFGVSDDYLFSFARDFRPQQKPL